MPKKYYSARTNPKKMTLNELYWKFKNFYILFRDRGYFEEKLGLNSRTHRSADAEGEAALALNFQPFPITKWSDEIVSEEHIFDVIEFLYDYVTKPIDVDWGGYNEAAGRAEYKDKVNQFLGDYGTGFELNDDGMVLALGGDVLRTIMVAEIVPFDEENVDSKVRSAIIKWRNRQGSLSEKKEAIREMADVFEWLKTKGGLYKAVQKSDASGLFDIANNFHIRHHNPKQKTDYDKGIWYSWMFHFYLATYHAAVRLILKSRKEKN